MVRLLTGLKKVLIPLCLYDQLLEVHIKWGNCDDRILLAIMTDIGKSRGKEE
jgi:hypothetical protein